MAAVLYATNKFPGDGVTTQFEFAFSGGYMAKADVKAYIENQTTFARTAVTVTEAMFVNATTLALGVSAPVGSSMVIYRDTPKTGPLVDFVGGSRITESNLDKVAKQSVFIGAEVTDATNVDAIANIGLSAGAAAASASAALVSQNAASASAADALTSKNAAATSATNAANSATGASNSAAAALASQTAAGNSAAAALTSQNAAATDAASALSSKNMAATSAAAALTSETNAAASYDSFDDRYLGPKTVAPTVDNDGNPLVAGTLYFDTVLVTFRGWTGSAWINLPATLASAVVNTPAGSIAAMNVQAALNELDTEKAKAGANADITSLTALTAGGLPDNSVTTPDIADLAVTPAKLAQKPTLGTPVSLSGTATQFTGIPTWAKRVVVSISGLSTNGASRPVLRIGPSSGMVSSGYLGSVTNLGTGVSSALVTVGFGVAETIGAVSAYHGEFTLILVDSSTNTWACTGVFARSDVASTLLSAGSIALAGALERVSLTMENGTDTFDAGTINILYEG